MAHWTGILGDITDEKKAYYSTIVPQSAIHNSNQWMSDFSLYPSVPDYFVLDFCGTFRVT